MLVVGTRAIPSEVPWPIIGRAGALASANAALDADGSVVFAGEAGIGKTALAALLAAELEAQSDAEVTRLAATSLIGLPLAAFGALVDEQGASAARAVVVLDDIQLLDDDAAVVLHRLVSDGRLQLVATLRTGETTPAAATALWKDGLVERIDLERLTHEQIDEVIACVLDGPVDPEIRLHLRVVTQGSPLMLR